MHTVERTLARALLRRARRFDKDPVLKALITRNVLEGLPEPLDGVVAKYLGGKGRLHYWPPLGAAGAETAAEHSVAKAVKEAFRHPPPGLSLDGGFQGLRYLTMLLSVAEKHRVLEHCPLDYGEASAGQQPRSGGDGSSNSGQQLQQHQAGAAMVGGGLQQTGEPERGVLLISHPSMEGWFKRTVVLLCQHHPRLGSYGLCLTKPLGGSVGDLTEKIRELKDRGLGNAGTGAQLVGSLMGLISMAPLQLKPICHLGSTAPASYNLPAALLYAMADAVGSLQDQRQAVSLPEGLKGLSSVLKLQPAAAASAAAPSSSELSEGSSGCGEGGGDAAQAAAGAAGGFLTADAAMRGRAAGLGETPAPLLHQRIVDLLAGALDGDRSRDIEVEEMDSDFDEDEDVMDSDDDLGELVFERRFTVNLPLMMKCDPESEDEEGPEGLSSGEDDTEDLGSEPFARSTAATSPQELTFEATLTDSGRLSIARVSGPAQLRLNPILSSFISNLGEALKAVSEKAVAQARGEGMAREAEAEPQQHEQQQAAVEDAGVVWPEASAGSSAAASSQAPFDSSDAAVGSVQGADGTTSGSVAAQPVSSSSGGSVAGGALGGAGFAGCGWSQDVGEPVGWGEGGPTVAQVLALFEGSQLFRGGPVEGLQVLHRCPEFGGERVLAGGPSQKHVHALGEAAGEAGGWSQGSGQAAGQLFFGARLQDAPELVRQGKLAAEDVKVFIGDCGWFAGQLEGELAAGSWAMVRADTEVMALFDQSQQQGDAGEAGGSSSSSMWERLLGRMGPQHAAMARLPQGVWRDLQQIRV